jgi:hypothetical protein
MCDSSPSPRRAVCHRQLDSLYLVTPTSIIGTYLYEALYFNLYVRSYQRILNRGEEYPETIKRRKASWIGHFLSRNFFLKRVIERKMAERCK